MGPLRGQFWRLPRLSRQSQTISTQLENTNKNGTLIKSRSCRALLILPLIAILSAACLPIPHPGVSEINNLRTRQRQVAERCCDRTTEKNAFSRPSRSIHPDSSRPEKAACVTACKNFSCQLTPFHNKIARNGS